MCNDSQRLMTLSFPHKSPQNYNLNLSLFVLIANGA